MKEKNNLNQCAFDMETGEIILLSGSKEVFVFKSLEGERIARRINNLFKKALAHYEEYKTYN